MKKTLALASLVLLAGCQEYLTRSELVSPYTGNATAANRTLQAADPWPRYVYNRNLKTSGQRQADAVTQVDTAHEEKAAAPLLPIASPTQ
ncbi:MAG: hypothetical protein KDJ80_15690 [Nitratireductor sp.]|nr:hypothetical protein [Nitratireductor sp.]